MAQRPTARFCLQCLTFACEHSRLESRYRPPALSHRELQVVRLLVKSSPLNKEIAFQLGLSEGTVKIYMMNMTKKLRAAGYPVTNRTALAAWALAHLPAAAGAEADEQPAEEHGE